MPSAHVQHSLTEATCYRCWRHVILVVRHLDSEVAEAEDADAIEDTANRCCTTEWTSKAD
eukprot:5958786-Amphidinium_carterae.1